MPRQVREATPCCCVQTRPNLAAKDFPWTSCATCAISSHRQCLAIFIALKSLSVHELNPQNQLNTVLDIITGKKFYYFMHYVVYSRRAKQVVFWLEIVFPHLLNYCRRILGSMTGRSLCCRRHHRRRDPRRSALLRRVD